MSDESEFEKWLKAQFPLTQEGLEVESAYALGARHARDWILEKARSRSREEDGSRHVVVSMETLEELLK